MTLHRWDPLRDLLKFHERANRLVGVDLEQALRKAPARWSPVVDVLETPDAFIFRVELPGVGKDNISVEVRGNTLTLSGERFIESEPKRAVYHRIERVHGVFERSFTLPDRVDAGQVEANYTDGVLEVVLPKTAGDSDRVVRVVCSS